MIRIGLAGLTLRPSARRVAALRRRFARDHFVRLPRLFEPRLLARALAAIDEAGFSAREGKRGLISAARLREPTADHLLTFCLHGRDFFDFVSAVAGCGPIAGFAGRTVRFAPGAGSFLDWHADEAHDGRRLASISVNLGRERCRGGVLEFRRPGSPRVISRIANKGLGDAVLFRSGGVLHRNTPLRGAAGKTSFAGWFYPSRPGRASMFDDSPRRAR